MSKENKSNARVVEFPGKVFHTSAGDYSNQWYQDYLVSAHYNMARDIDDNLQAYCWSLSLSGGKVSCIFNIEEQSTWRLTIYVFESNGEMIEFIKRNTTQVILGAVLSTGVDLIKN